MISLGGDREHTHTHTRGQIGRVTYAINSIDHKYTDQFNGQIDNVDYKHTLHDS